MKTRNNSMESLSDTCRLCGHPLPEKAVYQLNNVPRGVQYFPNEDDLEGDKGISIRVYQCTECGLIQLDGKAVTYNQEFTSATKYSKSMINHRNKQIKKFIDEYDLKGKKILDVGCGDGHMLDIICDQGAIGIGVDISKKALEIARSQGHTVHQVYVSRQNQLEDGPFDAFISNDVIEHVSDVKDFLSGIAINLKPGAVGMLEAPSFEKILEEHRFCDFMPDHISYFTLDILRIAFEVSGFEVISSKRSYNGENSTIIARKRHMIDFGPLKAHQDELMANLREFIKRNKISGRRVAIWGASYQTLILTSIVSLDVTYVIDSAVYKQNKITPVSHLRIVSPEILKRDPVDVIIVNAPIYEEEIVEQIIEREKFKGTIASLANGKIKVLRKA